MKREKKRVMLDDPIAIYNLGVYYFNGTHGFPQDHTKALELFHRAGKLGCADAYHTIGIAYDFGRGVEIDKEKANHYYELAAMMGNEKARHNLGLIEVHQGNMDRAIKHYTLAARSGYSNSLMAIQELYSRGHATKEDYMKALQSYQAYLGEIKSDQRDKAAAANAEFRYY